MEKQYLKTGYNLIDKDGKNKFISVDILNTSLLHMQKFKANIEKNISTLEQDLQEIASL